MVTLPGFTPGTKELRLEGHLRESWALESDRLGLGIWINDSPPSSQLPHPHKGIIAESTPLRWEDSMSTPLERASHRVGA